MTDHNRDLTFKTSEFKNSQKPVQKSTKMIKNRKNDTFYLPFKRVLYRIFHEPNAISKIVICGYM